MVTRFNAMVGCKSVHDMREEKKRKMEQNSKNRLKSMFCVCLCKTLTKLL